MKRHNHKPASSRSKKKFLKKRILIAALLVASSATFDATSSRNVISRPSDLIMLEATRAPVAMSRPFAAPPNNNPIVPSTPNGVAAASATAGFATSTSMIAADSSVDVTINAANDPVVAQSGVASTIEATPVTGTLRAEDPDGDVLTFTVVTAPTQGLVTITDASTGAFTYTPNAGAIGYDAFTFHVDDGIYSSAAIETILIVSGLRQWPGQTVRVSVAGDGAQGTAASTIPVTMSADGRFVAFDSLSPNLVPSDTNSASDVFVRDRQTGQTIRVSAASDGAQSNGQSQGAAISADGRYVAFVSTATNLVTNDTNGGSQDAFVRDLQTGETQLVSVASDGSQALGSSNEVAISGDGRYVAFTIGGTEVFVRDRLTAQTRRVSVSSSGVVGSNSGSPSISADGRYVVFDSFASNLVPNDTNGARDIFVHDQQTGETRRVSVAVGGVQANSTSYTPAISADGRYVAFLSFASNLVQGDENGVSDIFMHDRQTGETSRISVTSGGTEANNGSGFYPSISANGRFVAFQSTASNLAPGSAGDVFVRDRQSGETFLAHVTTDGSPASGSGWSPTISADGRFVAFQSDATHLVMDDTNSTTDIFVVGGVSVTPTSTNVTAAGGNGAVDVAFVYGDTAWTGVSHAEWLHVTGQSGPVGSGALNYFVDANRGAARIGTLTVAAQTVTITQDEGTKIVPVVTWPTPSDIVYGTALDATQLNATADVPGTFVYSPPEGTVLPAGNAQTLSVTFTPSDTANYAEASASVFLNVLKATPIITWPRPAAILYGTSLGRAQLNATANVKGTFFYTPPPGTILPIGAARPLSALLRPDDSANYTTATASVTIDVTSVGPPTQPPFQLLHTFTYSDGANPMAPLLRASDTFLYGTTSGGGPNGAGTVFRMDAAGTVTTLHTFTYSDGASPQAGLFLASDSLFYGTTVSGGPFGAGTVYRMDAAGTVTTLHAFNYSDGANPYAGLFQATDGFFYGTTYQGGPIGYGTVYRLDAETGTVTTLHAFTYSDGAYPRAGLIQAFDGFFYGTTYQGGAIGYGTVYRMDADGTFTTLHAFTYTNGANPYAGLIQGSDGLFYGTTVSGGPIGAGTTYQMDTTGALTTLHTFANTDGASPYAGLVQATDGFFYGTTSGGGPRQAGTVYRMDAAGNVTTLHAFTYSDGAAPSATPIQSSDGYLYGTTQSGGPQGVGTVFRVTLHAVRPLVSASQLFVYPVTAVFGGSTTLVAALTSTGVPLAGRIVSFALNGQPAGTVTTDANGFAFLGSVTLAGINAGTYPGAVAASFAGDASYLPGSATADLVVSKQTPAIVWAYPTPIVHGTPLGITQLNATTDVPGTFSYTPPAGTILPVGARQTLSVTFTPADLANYATVPARITIDVTSASDTQSTLRVIHQFAGSDGATPYGGLIQARDGFFYGTTAYGGANGYGTVYRTDGAGGVTTLHAFTAADGAYPYAALIQADDGLLYGTTAFGGPNGYGTVFRIDEAGNHTLLHAFTYTDGASPYAGLIQARDGLFYGTTSEGGFTGYGTVFRMDPMGAVTTLHAFANTDGAYPYGGLMQASDGVFYGTTLQGGTSASGTVYRMDTAGTVTSLHVFTWNDGAYPYAALIEGSDFLLYGTTSYGGASGFGTSSGSGTVFRVDPAGDVTTIHVFTGADGAHPYGSLLQRSDGFFYGTASAGGANGDGAIYRIDATGTLTTEHLFTWTDGATPYAGVIEGRDGFLYGTTQEGGAHNVGTVFRVALRTTSQLVAAPARAVYGGTTSLSATLTSASSPVAGRDVSFTLNGSPAGTVTTDASGIATVAGVSLIGLDPGTYAGAVSATFAGDDVYAPSSASADLIVAKLTPIVTWPTPSPIVYGTALDDTQLNATANVPGAFFYSPAAGAILPVGAGQLLSVVFVPGDSTFYATVVAHVAIDVTIAGPPTAPSFETLHVFSGADGSSPRAGLIQARDGFFYGTTFDGGSGYGTVYRLDAATGTVTTLHAFNNSDGASPYAGLVQAKDGRFYGTTYQGGTTGVGTVYRVDTDGTFTTLHAFTYTDGGYPYAGLIQAKDGLFYGTTYQGGTSGVGTVYRIDADGTFTTLHAFTNTDGAYPLAGVIQAKDGLFYGTTYRGGTSGGGTVYRMDATGTVTTLHAFTLSDGGYPFLGGLIQASDESFYGTTYYGGQNFLGTVYRVDAAGTLTTLHAFTGADGANPYAGLIQATDGFFYGTTFSGGSSYGTVYRMDAGGAVTTLHAFTYSDGAFPSAGLVQATDRNFYGTTQYGGPLGSGTVFRVALRTVTQLVASTASGYYGGTASLIATLTVGTSALPDREVSFALSGFPVGRATTDAFGVATVAGVSLAGFNAGTHLGVVSASFAGDTTYAASSASADLVVAKLAPIVTWSAPAAIAYGTALDTTQLNATSNVAGMFIYDPPAGTILPVGAGQVLSLTFTPFDTTNYTSVVATVTIDVVVGTPLFQTTDFGTFSLGRVETPLIATGGNGTYVWEIVAGSLPPGLSLRTDRPSWFPPSASAGISGVATAGGTYPFTLRVTSNGQAYERPATITVSTLVVKDLYNIADAFVGEPYSYMLTALRNGALVSATWTPIDGFTTGITLSPDGVLSGTPAAADAGFHNLWFSVTEGGETVFRGVGVNVYPIDISTPGQLPNATQNAPYDTAILASGGSGIYTFFANGGIPNGLVFSSSGTISGSANTGPGRYSFNVTVFDTVNLTSYTKTMSIDVIGVPPTLPWVIPYGNYFSDCTLGVQCNAAIAVLSGGTAPYTWSASGLPLGMSIRTGSGTTSPWIVPGDAEIWGTPVELGPFPIQVTVTDVNGVSARNTFPLRVSPLMMDGFLPGGTLGDPYSFKLRVLGGPSQTQGRDETGLYSVTQTGGTLPRGVTLDGSNLLVAGTPEEGGNFNPQLRFTDPAGDTLQLTSYFFINAPVIINSPNDLGTATLDASYFYRLFACCAPSFVWSVVEGILPPGIMLTSDGSLTGRPTTEGPYTFLVQATDASDGTRYGKRQLTLTVTPLVITTGYSLPAGNVGSPYNVRLATTGGTGALTFTVASDTYLPPGLLLDPSGTLTGTPTATGQYFFNVNVTDSASHVATGYFNLSVYPAGAFPPVQFFLSSDFGTFSIGQIDGFALFATGGNGTYAWEIVGGSLPPGLSIRTDLLNPFFSNASAGIIGVATTPGNYRFTLRVTSGGQTFERTTTMRISSLVVKDSYTISDAFVGAPYSYALTALRDGAAVAATWTPNGPLPPGMTLGPDGQLSGTPTATGFYNINFRVTDGGETVFRNVGVNVYAVQITSPAVLPNATQNTAYPATTATASGGSGSYSFTGSGFPNGLSISSSGVISGSANTGPGKFTATVTVRDTATSASYSKRLSIVVIGVPPRLPAVGPYGGFFSDCTIGVPCSRGVSVNSGGAAPFTWTATGLPPGMSIRSDDSISNFISPGDGELWGTPTQAGPFDIEVTVTDASGASASNSFPLHVSELLQTCCLTNGTIGVPYSQKLRVIGGSGPYTATQTGGQLPAGLTLDGTNLQVTGTPLENGNFNATFRFTDASGHTLQSGNFLFISGGTSTITINNNGSLGTVTTGQFYFNFLSACCAPSLTWSRTDGALPPGISLSTSGQLSGTPDTPGTYTFLIRAADSSNPSNFGARRFTLTVSPLSIATASALPFGNVDAAYSQGFTATGGTGTLTWTLAPFTYLPPGLTLASNGTLSGTATATGQFFFTVGVADTASHTAARQFRLSIYAAGTTPPLFQSQGPNFGTWGIGQIETPLSATGGNGSYAWSVIAGSLPPGISVRSDSPSWFPSSASAGLVGVATTTGTYTFTLRLTSSGQTADQPCTIKVVELASTENQLPDAFVATPYSYQLHAQGNAGAVTWTATSTLPAGLSLSSSGLLSGTPTTAGFANVSFSLTDGVDTVYYGVNFQIYAVNITTAGVLPNATQNAAYTATISATGGAGGYTFTANNLPFGVFINSSTGVISGTVISGPGKFNVQVTARDTNSASYSKNMSIIVIGVPAALPFVTPYGSTGLDDCTIGVPCSRGVGVTNGGTAPFTWTATGLPPGMAIRFGSGTTVSWISAGDVEVWGRPTAAGIYNVQLTVMDANSTTATNIFPLNVSTILQTSFLPNGTLGTAYAQTLRVIGGAGSYSAARTGGRLAAGLTLNSGTLSVSSTPIESGSFNPRLTYTDSASQTLSTTNYFNVNGAGSGGININTNSDLGSTTTGSSYSRTLSACCAGSITWSSIGESLPAGVTLTSAGVLTGTPTVSGQYSFLVRAADGANAVNYAARQFTLNVTTINITTGSTLPFGNVDAAYSQGLTATGGTGALTWTLAPLNNFLPPGLTLSSSGTISGTPTATGQFSFTVIVSDTASHTLSRTFNVSIYPAGSAPPLFLNIGPNFGTRAFGVLTQPLAATGGVPPYHYSLTPEATVVPGMRVQDGQPLPTSFPSSTTGGYLGVLAAPGVFNTSIRVTDSVGSTFDRAITFTVSPLQIVSQSSLPKTTVNTPYSFTMTPYGGSGTYTWSATNLPEGMTMSASGLLSGTPTSSGAFFPFVTLKDTASNTISSSFTLTVDPFAIATNGVLPSAVVGVPYNQTLSAPNCAGPCTWTTSFTPSGLTFSSAGVLSGTPTGSTNTFFTATANGSNGTVSKVFSLFIASSAAQTLSISNASSLGFTTIGSLVATSLFAFGGTAPYTFTLQSGTLPPGVTLQNPGESLGSFLGPGFYYLTGRAMQLGAYTFTLAVTDAANVTVTKAFSWTITPVAHQYFSLPISGTPLVYNTAYRQPLLAIGGDSTYTWAANGAMPPGLNLDTVTGIVSGTPTNTGFFSVPIQVTDGVLNTTVSTIGFTISSGTAATVNIGLGPTLGTIQQGFTITFSLFLSGGTTPYTATALTALPPGFALECGDALPSGTPGSSCQLVGLPLATGAFTFTVRADDSAGNFGVKTFTLNVAPLTLFSSTSLPDASVGVEYSQTIKAWDNSSAVGWSIASGATLPVGLTLSTAGVISGTPTQAGAYSFVLSATAGSGPVISFTFSLRVSGIAITDPALLPSAATVGVPFTYTFTATGGTPPLTWSATQLPAGLTMSAAGVLSGTITGGGSVTAILVTATDGGTTTTRRFGLVLRTATPGILNFFLLSAALADVTVGQSLSVPLTASGGVPPYTWALAPGSTLPPGLTLVSGASLRSTDTPGSTVLAGVPGTAGQYAFDLIVTDAVGTQLRRTFTLTVSAINLLFGMRNPTVGTAYAQRFTAVGGSLPYTFTMTPSSLGFDMLPPGLTFTSDGLLSGTPTGTGSFGFLLRAQDAAGHAYSRAFSFQSTTAAGLFVSTGNPTDGSVGVGRSFSLFVSNFSTSISGLTFTWSITGGSLPPGMTLQSIGSNTFIEGRVAIPGTYSFTVRGTDTSNGANFAERLLTFRVAPMQIVPPPVGFVTPNATSRFLPSAQVLTAYSTTINIAGGTPPYSFSVPPTSPVPPGLTLSPAGVLAGTPTGMGSYSISFVVQDATGALLNVIGSQLDVAQAAGITPLRIGALTTPVGSATVGVPYRLALADIFGGVAPYTWSLAPGSTLPAGLAILPGSNGVSSYLAGVPTKVGFNLFSFVVTDSAGQSIAVSSFPLAVSALSLSPDWLPNGMVGATYSATLTAAGGTAPYTTQSALSTDLPPGLALSTTGVISGTPTYPGNFVIGVLVTPTTGPTFTRYYNVTIDNASGQARGVSLSARAIQINYAIGSTPSPIPVTINATTGTSPFQLAVEGLSSVTLSATTGTAPGSVNLNLNTVSLTAPGTFFGLLGLYAPESASQLDAVPIILTVTAPTAAITLATPAGGATYVFGQP